MTTEILLIKCCSYCVLDERQLLLNIRTNTAGEIKLCELFRIVQADVQNLLDFVQSVRHSVPVKEEGFCGEFPGTFFLNECFESFQKVAVVSAVVLFQRTELFLDKIP